MSGYSTWTFARSTAFWAHLESLDITPQKDLAIVLAIGLERMTLVPEQLQTSTSSTQASIAMNLS